ncbi:MAG: DsrE/DsrF/DrsH-like family protein, partial [Candidatus Eisenbacteria bacterium]|nr:DsrE/DsrF/DrsH-like family protein [Candidatus Eisenbacteria bacterium]
MPDVQEMLALAKGSGVKLIACTTTMKLMGIPKEQLTVDADACAGVAAYLAEASESSVNLFI